MTIDAKNGTVNTQLANAAARLHVANERLASASQRTYAARREETAALNEVNEAQKHFEELVAFVRGQAPRDTGWGQQRRTAPAIPGLERP